MEVKKFREIKIVELLHLYEAGRCRRRNKSTFYLSLIA